jgi:hypothetical protein
MPPFSMMLFVMIGFSALLLALLVLRPGITRSTEGMILAGIALFVAPALAAHGGISEHIQRSESTAYCLSCHVMADYGKSMRVDDPEFLRRRTSEPIGAGSGVHSAIPITGGRATTARRPADSSTS